MKRFILQSFLGVSLLIVWGDPVYGVEAHGSAQLSHTALLTTPARDDRVIKLEGYLQAQNSPLSPYAAIFVEKADQYNLPDWRLVPAITGVESTFGKVMPANSYNAYGWGNGSLAFNSWDESIDKVSRTLKEKYIDRGADTPEKMSPIYAPPSHTWAGKVRFFMDKIERFTPILSDSLAFTL